MLPGPALPASTCEEGLAAFACRGPGFSFGRGAERGMGVRWAKQRCVVRRAEGGQEGEEGVAAEPVLCPGLCRGLTGAISLNLHQDPFHR